MTKKQMNKELLKKMELVQQMNKKVGMGTLIRDDGSFLDETDINNKIEFAHDIISKMELGLRQNAQTVAELRKEVKVLKEKSDNERIIELQELIKEKDKEIEELNNLNYYGITKEERNKALKWLGEHQPEPKGFYKARHWLKWEITPTGIGVVKTAICSCGKKYTITEDF